MRGRSSVLLLWMIIESAVLAIPHALSSRNVSASAVITTNIISASSNDTLPFRILLYTPPAALSLPSLTGRAFDWPGARTLSGCRSPTAVFHHSHCLHNPMLVGGMQRYVIYCRESQTTAGEHSHTTHPRAEPGMCKPDENCVNTWHGDPVLGFQLARCIAQKSFEPYDAMSDDPGENGHGRGQGKNQDSDTTDRNWDDEYQGDNSGHVGGEKRRKLVHGFVLGGNQASVVFSKEDGVTPLGVKSIAMDASMGTGTTLMEKTCRDCAELKTKTLAPNTEQLNLEASIVSTGAGIAAGVMWVALFSG